MKEKRLQYNLDSRQEVNLVRRILAITIIVSFMGLGILFVTGSNENSGISLNSGFGEIIIFDPKQIHFFNADTYYQNNELSFQISKPDDKWKIRPAYEGLSLKALTLLESKGYLEGIYLEKENDKRFLLLVFDIQSENFQLDDYIENQITSINFKEDVKIPIKQISQSNDWAIFSLDRETNDETSYAEQLLFLKDYRLYMLQYSGKSPENLTELEKSDFNLILDSFEVF